MQKNTLTSFLDLLNVKYTPSFTTKHFNEHPHKYNLYGLSEMLSDYGVENNAMRIEDKENDLFNIPLPFIAHIGSDFVVVYQIDDKGVKPTTSIRELLTEHRQFNQNVKEQLYLFEC